MSRKLKLTPKLSGRSKGPEHSRSESLIREKKRIQGRKTTGRTISSKPTGNPPPKK